MKVIKEDSQVMKAFKGTLAVVLAGVVAFSIDTALLRLSVDVGSPILIFIGLIIVFNIMAVKSFTKEVLFDAYTTTTELVCVCDRIAYRFNVIRPEVEYSMKDKTLSIFENFSVTFSSRRDLRDFLLFLEDHTFNPKLERTTHE